ncbi:MAG: hypothetical protein ACYDCL_06820 [Myxococcales bacterium]
MWSLSLLLAPVLAAAPTEGKLLAWAQTAARTQVDCPMTPEQAAAFASYHGRRGLDEMIHYIGCSCEASWEGGRWRSLRPKCDVPDSDVYWSAKNALDRAIWGWFRKLRSEPRGSDPTRAAPLGTPTEAQGDAPELRASPAGRQLVQSYREVKDDGARGLWTFVPRAVEAMQGALGRLEQSLGRESAPGRALLADARSYAKSHHHEIASLSALNDRLERDPQLRQLRGQKETLEARLEEQKRALGMPGPMGETDYCANPRHDPTRVCTLHRQVDAVDDKIRRREAALGASE